MKHGSLFSGMGGFDLAAQWMGWENVFHCEWNPFGQKILKHYWPNAKSYDDITKTNFTLHRGEIDILTGGFPCQPFSNAGKRKGKNDNRYLWPQFRRAIREIQPRIIVAENVAGLFTILEPKSLSEVEIKEIQLFSENKEYQVNDIIKRVQRRVISTIIEEIRAEGYVFPTYKDGSPIICCIPACATNAPHRRDRIWFVAYAISQRTRTSSRRVNQSRELLSTPEWQQNKQFNKSIGEERTSSIPTNSRIKSFHKQKKRSNKSKNVANSNISHECALSGKPRKISEKISDVSNTCRQKLITNTKCIGQSGSGRTEGQVCSEENRKWKASWSYDDGRWPTQSPVCNGDDGLSARLDGISFSKWRAESIKGGGNAIVPQVAYEIFKAIEKMKNASSSNLGIK